MMQTILPMVCNDQSSNITFQKKITMNDIELKLQSNNRGAFVIEEGQERIAEMAIAIEKGNLIVFHTEVSDKLKGQGVAKQLLDRMVAYARENKLKVVPLCPFVLAQFKRHPEQFEDIWNKDYKQGLQH
jgi:predicted GNAT family acetyltransferase